MKKYLLVLLVMISLAIGSLSAEGYYYGDWRTRFSEGGFSLISREWVDFEISTNDMYDVRIHIPPTKYNDKITYAILVETEDFDWINSQVIKLYYDNPVYAGATIIAFMESIPFKMYGDKFIWITTESNGYCYKMFNSISTKVEQ